MQEQYASFRIQTGFRKVSSIEFGKPEIDAEFFYSKRIRCLFYIKLIYVHMCTYLKLFHYIKYMDTQNVKPFYQINFSTLLSTTASPLVIVKVIVNPLGNRPPTDLKLKNYFDKKRLNMKKSLKNSKRKSMFNSRYYSTRVTFASGAMAWQPT